MQIERFPGWSAGPRPRVGVVAIAISSLAALVGALLGWVVQATILPGASFAVIALACVGAALGGLYVTSLTVADDEPEAD